MMHFIAFIAFIDSNEASWPIEINKKSDFSKISTFPNLDDLKPVGHTPIR